MIGLTITAVVTALNVAMTGVLVIFTMKQIWIWKRRMMKMSDCTCTNCVFITEGRRYWDMDFKTHVALELHCEKNTKRRLKMSDCKYCGGDCPEQVDKNGKARAGFICNGYAVGGMYRESTIKTLFKGEFVLVDMIDETIELTVENNVYSRSESLELLEELKMACATSRIADSMIGMRGIEDE
jgi:hypothetical protein